MTSIEVSYCYFLWGVFSDSFGSTLCLSKIKHGKTKRKKQTKKLLIVRSQMCWSSFRLECKKTRVQNPTKHFLKEMNQNRIWSWHSVILVHFYSFTACVVVYPFFCFSYYSYCIHNRSAIQRSTCLWYQLQAGAGIYDWPKTNSDLQIKAVIIIR